MENYERTMELVDVAQNSAGKSQKQFAKFSDSVEFKVNKLKNTLEQVRTSIINQDTINYYLELGDKIAKKLQGLDFTKIIKIAPIALTFGRQMASNWIKGFSDGIKKGRGAISNLLGKAFGKGQGLQERIKELDQIQKEINDISNAGKNLENLKLTLPGAQEAISLLEEADQNIKDIQTKLNTTNTDKPEEEINKLKQELEEAQQAALNLRYTISQDSFQGMELIKNYDLNKQKGDISGLKDKAKVLKNSIANSKMFQGLGQAAGSAMATAAMMAFTGNFDLSDITKTTAIQSAVTAISQAFSGNLHAALGSAFVGAISWGISELSKYIDEQNEKAHLAADGVYKWTKRLEELEDKQEKLNETLDKANKEYDEQKEVYDSISEANETYQELSKKILLTEEEQENLNNATQTLLDYMPNLLAGYDSQHNAILKSGDAYDELIEKQKQSLILAAKEQNEAEKKAKLNEMEIELAKRNKSRAEVYQIEELQGKHGDYTNTRTGIWEDRTYYLSQILNPREAGFGELTDTGEVYAEAVSVLSKDNTVLQELVAELLTEEGMKKVKDLEDLDIFGIEAFAKKLQEKINELDPSTFSSEEYDAFVKDLSDIWLTTLDNDIDLYFLENPEVDKLSKEKQDLLEEVIKKALVKEKDIEDIIKENTTAEGIDTKNIEKQYKEYINDLLDEDLIKEIESLSNADFTKYGDFVAEAYLEPIEKLEEDLKNFKGSENVKKLMEVIHEDVKNSYQKSYDEIKEIYGQGFEGSELDQILQNVGAESAANIANAFGKFDSNEAAKAFMTTLSKNLEQYSNLPTEALTYLLGQDWDNFDWGDFSKTKQAFINYCDTLEEGVDNAEQIFDDFFKHLNTFNVLETPGLLTIESLEENLLSGLDEKVSASSGLADAVQRQLENGVLTFSESQSFKEACEKIGLNAEDYISYGIDGSIAIDTEALKQGLEDQKVSEQEVLDEVRNTLQAKRDELSEQLAIYDAVYATLDGDTERRNVAVDIANAYWDAAAALAEINPNIQLSDRKEYQLNFTGVSKDDIESRRQEIIDAIASIDEALANLNPNSPEFKALMTQYEAAYNEMLGNVEEGITNAAETTKTKEKDAEEALKAWEDQLDAVNEKTKTLAETIQGTEWFDAGVDPMYNYTTALERVSKAADKAKTALTELNDNVDPQQAMDKYLDAIHQEAAISEAEARTYAKAIANGQKVVNEKLSKEIEKINKATGSNMSTDVSELYKLYGDRYSIDINRLNSLNINDEFKKMLADEIKSWNDNLDKIEELEDKRLQRIKEFKEAQKSALQSIVNLQEEMKNALKEKYEQEIEDIENKYKAMEEADNDYVSALEESIKRQRELRERETQWNDLADKERKLSLMQRDTSGGNLVATRQLEKEVQTDRQKLLDDSVDDIIDGLKEMYELQKESREAEIEYRKALLDDGMLMQEVATALEQIHSADDLVAWFESVTDVSNMSKEQLELERLSWEEMYEAKEVYLETSTAQFEEALMVTEEDIQNVVAETSENLTTMADWTLEKIGNSVEEAITKAQKDLDEARTQLQEKWSAYLDALAKTVQQGTTVVKKEQDTKDLITNTALKGLQTAQNYTKYSVLRDNVVTKTSIQNYTNSTASVSNLLTKINNLVQQIQSIAKTNRPTTLSGTLAKINNLIQQAQSVAVNKPSIKSGLSEIGNLIQQIRPDNVSVSAGTLSNYIIRMMNNLTQQMQTKAYAKGGLVDYTGPAWVDGTKSKPEAFLSSEDTKRIGEAAKILAQLPLLNSEVDKNNITNNSIGDTTINLNLTVENISSDYDVDQAVERVKKDIVEAAKYRGSNVILNKRV